MRLQGLGWLCYIRVDGTTYTLWGQDNLPKSVDINQSSLVTTELTPTRTIQVMKAGPMNVTVTFLSPVDVGRQFVALFTELIMQIALRFTTTVASVLLCCTGV